MKANLKAASPDPTTDAANQQLQVDNQVANSDKQPTTQTLSTLNPFNPGSTNLSNAELQQFLNALSSDLSGSDTSSSQAPPTTQLAHPTTPTNQIAGPADTPPTKNTFFDLSVPKTGCKGKSIVIAHKVAIASSDLEDDSGESDSDSEETPKQHFTALRAAKGRGMSLSIIFMFLICNIFKARRRTRRTRIRKRLQLTTRIQMQMQKVRTLSGRFMPLSSLVLTTTNRRRT